MTIAGTGDAIRFNYDGRSKEGWTETPKTYLNLPGLMTREAAYCAGSSRSGAVSSNQTSLNCDTAHLEGM